MQPRLLVLTVTVAAALTACGPLASPGSDRVDHDREIKAAENDKATAAEIVDAGSPVAADRAGDGSTLVAYMVVGDVGEVSQTAWRLYDNDGDPVTARKYEEHESGTTVVGLEEGFYVEHVGLVGPDGTVEKFPKVGRNPVKPGDVAVEGFERHRALRPDGSAVFEPRPKPTGWSQGWAIDADGRMWYQRIEGKKQQLALYVAQGGEPWQRVRDLDVQGRADAIGFGVTPVGDLLVLPVARPVDHANRDVFTRLAVREAAAGPASRWRYLDPGPLGEDKWNRPEVFAADDHTLVLSGSTGQDYEQSTLALDLATEEWRRMGHPTGEDFWSLRRGRGGIYAVHDDHGAAWLSDDLGESWESLPR